MKVRMSSDDCAFGTRSAMAGIAPDVNASSCIVEINGFAGRGTMLHRSLTTGAPL